MQLVPLQCSAQQLQCRPPERVVAWPYSSSVSLQCRSQGYSAGRLIRWRHGPPYQLRSVAGLDFSCQGLAAWQHGGGAGRLTSWR